MLNLAEHISLTATKDVLTCELGKKTVEIKGDARNLFAMCFLYGWAFPQMMEVVIKALREKLITGK